jgi:hypothetical protein
MTIPEKIHFAILDQLQKGTKTIKEACESVIRKNKLNMLPSSLSITFSRWHLKTFGEPPSKKHQLSLADDLALIGYLNASFFSHCGLNASGVIAVVREWKGKSDTWDGWGWWNRFYKKYSKLLRIRDAKELTSARADPSLDEVRLFARRIEALLKIRAFNENCVANLDETIWSVKKSGLIQSVVGTPDGKAHQEDSRATDVACSVACVVPGMGGFVNFLVLKSGKPKQKKG